MRHRIGYIALNLRAEPERAARDDAERIVALADPARDAGLEVGFGGYLGQKVSKPETHSSEVIGLGMAVIVLLFTFGTVVAMGLPIVTAIIGLVCGLSIITLLSHVAEVPTVAPTLATMIGLGVGIDYALFIVTRHLQQRRDGMETRGVDRPRDGDLGRRGRVRGLHGDGRAAVARRGRHPAGHDARLHVGAGRGGRGRGGDHAAARDPRGSSATGSTGCGSRCRTARPTIIRTAGCAGAASSPVTRCRARSSRSSCWLVLALPTLDLYLGQQDNGAMPESTDARRASDGMTAGFGAGTNGPLLVSVDMSQQAGQGRPGEPQQALQAGAGPEGQGQPAGSEQEQQIAAQLEAQGMPPAQAQAQAQAQVQPQLDKQIDKIEQQSKTQRKKLEQPATDPRLQDLKKDIAKTSGVKKVSEPLVNSDGTAAVLNATPTTEPSDQATADLVDHAARRPRSRRPRRART